MKLTLAVALALIAGAAVLTLPVGSSSRNNAAVVLLAVCVLGPIVYIMRR